MRIRWRGLELPSRVAVDRETRTGTYGKFVAEPFERGFGATIGNSLRRILLSSLEGSAITRARIQGVQHEFTTIPGVVEDVTDICLNLKSLVVKNHSSSSKTLRIEKNTRGDVHDQALDLSIEQTLFSCLTNQAYCVEKGIGVHPGIVEAPLVGGNLECFIALMGTPYQPDFKGSILFIEEVRQEPYKIDCMLSHLDLAGIMDQVVGVVFCQFEKCLANYFPDRDGTVDNVIDEWAKRLTVPVLKNFPYGHGSNHQYVLPIGGKVRLDANAHSLAIIF